MKGHPVRWIAIAFSVGMTALALSACAATSAAAARDPMKCERDPNCKSHQRAFDCSAQCSDDPACVDRCTEIQQQTGTSAAH